MLRPFIRCRRAPRRRDSWFCTAGDRLRDLRLPGRCVCFGGAPWTRPLKEDDRSTDEFAVGATIATPDAGDGRRTRLVRAVRIHGACTARAADGSREAESLHSCYISRICATVRFSSDRILKSAIAKRGSAQFRSSTTATTFISAALPAMQPATESSSTTHS